MGDKQGGNKVAATLPPFAPDICSSLKFYTMPHLSEQERRELYPHKHYGFKCGQFVSYKGITYMFMGYVGNDKGCIHLTEEIIVPLWELQNAR